jgi:integrase
VRRLVENSLSDNTKRAYLSDLAHFSQWGGAIPSSDRVVALYLAAHAEGLSIATLARRLVSIAKAHHAKGLLSPVASELVRATLKGIRREHGSLQTRAKPLLLEELIEVTSSLGDGLKDVRDRALLLLGFAGAFRRSELVGVDVEHLTRVRQGLLITLHRSKTDQFGASRTIAIPFGRNIACPVCAIERWLSLSGTRGGPLFTLVNRHGQRLEKRLSAEAVSLILKARLVDAGQSPDGYSGHSLRAGLATSAAQKGVPAWKIRAQTGHASDNMLNRYIRDAELFMGNAAGALL